jgi:hypothetical protein
MSSNGQKPMTWAELKAQIDTMTPEQLAMPVYYTGEDIGGPVYRVWVLGEDYINPSGDGMERVSEVRRCLIEDGMTESEADEEIAGEPVVAFKGEPLLDVTPPLEMGQEMADAINKMALAHAAANLGITLTPEVEEFGRQFEALMQTEAKRP